MTLFYRVLILLSFCTQAFAGAPLWTFTPLTATTLTVPANATATVQYQVTNQSFRSHTLMVRPMAGVTQLTTGFGICSNPFMLAGNASCVLSLQITGSALTQPISGGPVVCTQGSMLQCYQPSPADALHITQEAVSGAIINVSGSPLSLSTNGSAGSLTITNNSYTETATNIMADFTGTALDGNVTETGNTCTSVPPLASCVLSFTPGGAVVSLTTFPIQGSNTNAITAEIEINESPALSGISPTSGMTSGGTGVTLTGTALTGATSVTFGGVAATSVNVVNSTTVTAVTPAHALGVVDVAITTPGGTSVLTNGYTYVVTAIGLQGFGGVVACLNGGFNDLIAAVADNSAGVTWGGFGTLTTASNNTNGSANTSQIVTTLGNNGGVPYAAKICSDYQVDSQGNTPCEPGNTCYDDWFLPAGNNTTPTGQLNCLFTNQGAIGGFNLIVYWSSTEQNNNFSFAQDFSSGLQINTVKSDGSGRVRCVRAFTE